MKGVAYMKRKWRSAAARRICELAGVRSVEQAVIEIGRRLTDDLRSRPTNLEAILPRVDVQSIHIDADLLVSGELRKTEDGLEIVCSGKQSHARQRFTIAHEIGHAVIERTGNHCPRRGKELEQICDLIASEILAPRAAMISEAKEPLGLTEVSRLSRLFEMSVTAMALRCASIFGIIVFQSEYGEMSWSAGESRKKLHAATTQLREFTKLDIHSSPGFTEVEVVFEGQASRKCLLESLATGEKRRLFVLTQQVIPVETIDKLHSMTQE